MLALVPLTLLFTFITTVVFGRERAGAVWAVRAGWQGYMLAVVFAGGMLLVKLAISHVWTDESPFLLFPLSVLLAAWYGGLGPGLFATLLSAVAAGFFFIQPQGTLAMGTGDWMQLMAYLAESVLFCFLSLAVRRAKEHLTTSHRLLETRYDNLQQTQSALQQRERELRQLTATLEERVAERTRELAETVALLQRSNLELEARNRELQDFAFVASHDLQEPLRKISTFADLLRSEAGDRLGEEATSYVERMQAAALRMSQLLNDLLDFTRVQTRGGAFSLVDLNRIAAEVLSDLDDVIRAAEAKIEVEELAHVTADPTQIEQLLKHLLENAIKFRRRGVRPAVRIRTTVSEEALIPAGSRTIVALEIEDNGIGMDEQYAERIFSPFQRLHPHKYPGTGMGLAICRRIVERHGGTIGVRSTRGAGSSFTVVLPEKQDSAGA